MLKVLGACMIIGSCGLAGIINAKKYSDRPKELKMLLSALQNLETEINYCAAPLPEALERIAETSMAKVAPFFKLVQARLKDSYCSSAADVWREALAETAKNLSLKPADLKILQNLGNNLGRSDQSDQIKHIKLAEEMLRCQIDYAEAEAQKSVKMWNYLGFLGGLALILLLY